VKEGFWFSVKVTFVLLLAVSAAGFAWAPQLVSIFRDDPEVIAIGTAALRFQCVTFCLQQHSAELDALARDLAGRIASFKLMAPSSPH
jgi:Na+-driven multidrug efflux pump